MVSSAGPITIQIFFNYILFLDFGVVAKFMSCGIQKCHCCDASALHEMTIFAPVSETVNKIMNKSFASAVCLKVLLLSHNISITVISLLKELLPSVDSPLALTVPPPPPSCRLGVILQYH